MKTHRSYIRRMETVIRKANNGVAEAIKELVKILNEASKELTRTELEQLQEHLYEKNDVWVRALWLVVDYKFKPGDLASKLHLVPFIYALSQKKMGKAFKTRMQSRFRSNLKHKRLFARCSNAADINRYGLPYALPDGSFLPLEEMGTNQLNALCLLIESSYKYVTKTPVQMDVRDGEGLWAVPEGDAFEKHGKKTIRVLYGKITLTHQRVVMNMDAVIDCIRAAGYTVS